MKNEIRIVLLPPDDVAEAAIELSARITNTFDTAFTLSASDIAPHITLIKLESGKSIPEMYKALREVISRAQPVDAVFSDIDGTLGWVGANIVSPAILDIRGALEHIAREHCFTFGSWDYVPHLTFSRLKDFENIQLNAELFDYVRMHWQHATPFTLNRIAIGPNAPHGTFPLIQATVFSL